MVGTHIFFVCDSEKKILSTILSFAEREPILTTGDIAGLHKKVAPIGFGRKVRAALHPISMLP